MSKLQNYNVIASTYQNKFIDIFDRNKLLYIQATHFTLLCYWFLTSSGKTNGVQTNAGHDNTEYVLTTNLACIFL